VTVATDPATLAAWRPRYHITGERNWINDPNGPIHHRGVYHLFYQANPDSPFWGPPSWGHVTSTDLVNWARHPLALTPADAGPDVDGCWSGCAQLVGGRPALYYTGVIGEDDRRVESVCRAWGSDDLLHWHKDPANPLLAGPPRQRTSRYHRDPFLWRDEDGWHMLLGSGTTDAERHGQILRYDSRDGTAWTYRGIFFEAPRSLGAIDLGEHWECPQLLLDGHSAILIVSCQAPETDRPLMHAVHFTGNLRDGRFEGELGGVLDHGDVFYAPALCHDGRGRTLLWGWAQERITQHQQAALSHAGALSLSRQVTTDAGRLLIRPVPELDRLRRRRIPPNAADLNGRVPGSPMTFPATPQMELTATCDGSTGRAGWTLADDDGNARTTILVDLDERRLDVTVADGRGPARSLRAPLPARPRHELRVFLDGSLLEIFADGERALTTRSYATAGAHATAALVSTSHPEPRDVHVWELSADTIG
jgi:beta-fructofuranosidase